LLDKLFLTIGIGIALIKGQEAWVMADQIAKLRAYQARIKPNPITHATEPWEV